MYDVIVIGTGPGGYHAAIRAAQLGLKVMAVEKEKVGGVCLNRGCIPTKFLLNTTGFLKEVELMKRNGIEVKGVEINLEKMQMAKERVVNKLVKGVEFLFRKNGVELIRGKARILKNGVVEVNGKSYETGNIVIATGSLPRDIPGIKRDGEKIIYGEEALFLKKLPQSVCIVGGGPTGLEIGNILSNLGVHVNIVEMMDQIVPGTDKELAEILEKALKKKGIKIYTSTLIKDAHIHNGKVEVNLGRETINVDILILSAGRIPASEDFDFLKRNSSGYITVNERLETSMDNVYAIGDVTGPPLLAHKAMKQGVEVAEIIAGIKNKYHPSPIPYVVYTDPPLFSIGKREDEIEEPVVGRFPFSASGMASVKGKIEGLSKMVIEDGRIKGVHIIGDESYHIGGEAIPLVSTEMDIKLFTELIHPHPTLTEILLETGENALKKAIHILNQ